MSLKTILVDDEIKALERVQRLAVGIPELEIVGTFQKSGEALEYLQTNPVDLALLDIEMPDMTGLELAEAILESKPEIDTVFVTAYDRYALEAFQANAVGYLLKPIEQQDLKLQIDRILKKKMTFQQGLSDQTALQRISLTIQCFGGFYCYKDPGKHELIKWRTAKAEELFALLIHHQGRPVSRDKVLDLLWPDMDFDRASKNLHAISYYIRETLQELGYRDLFVRSGGQYQLRLDQVYQLDQLDQLSGARIQVDALEFVSDASQKDLNNMDLGRLDKLSSLYRGRYLEGKDYDWAVSSAGWFESKCEEMDLIRADRYRKSGNGSRAVEILSTMVRRNPILEEAYQRLIELLLQEGNEAEAKRWYQVCERNLWEELQVEPSVAFKKTFLNQR